MAPLVESQFSGPHRDQAIAVRSEHSARRGLNPSPIRRYAAKGKPKAYGQEVRGKKCNA